MTSTRSDLIDSALTAWTRDPIYVPINHILFTLVVGENPFDLPLDLSLYILLYDIIEL